MIILKIPVRPLQAVRPVNYSAIRFFPGGIRTLLISLTVSLLISIVLCEWKGDQWEEVIRQYYYKVFSRDPIPSEHKTYIDHKGIPFVHYYEQNGINPGKQYNPTITSVFAIHYYRKFKNTSDPDYQEKFFSCIGWLENNIIYKNGSGLFEIKWRQPYYPAVETPWRSAMSSGLAIEAFMVAQKLNPVGKYSDISKELLRGFYLEVQDGGFTYRDSTGWWYEQYACSNAKTPRVLNGHIYSLLAAYKLWSAEKNDSAYFIFQKGLESLRNDLPQYDAGDGWSYYDISGKKADKKYQKIIVVLMKKLWNITGDPLFYQYYIKWKTPLDKPYVMRIIGEKNRSGTILFVLLTLILMILIYCFVLLLNRYRIKTY